MLTINTLFENTVSKFPDQPALVYGNESWTYAEWNKRVRRLAQALSDLGVQAADCVVIFMKTSEATATAYMACQMLGAIAVPINFRLSSNEASYIIRDCHARVLIYDDSLLVAVEKISAGFPDQPIFICASDEKRAVPASHLHLDSLIEASDERLASKKQPMPNDIAALVYTSGTTGRPKGVIHTHANDVAIASNCVMEYSLTRDDIALHIAPLYHVGGMQAYFIPHLMVGGLNVILPRYEPLSTLEMIERFRVTTLFAVPTQIQDMLFHPQFNTVDVSSLRMITTGGAAIPAATMARVINEFCPNIFNGYGMTEASLTLLLHPRDALSHLGSCGKPTLISSCRIVKHDPERNVFSDEIAGVGEVGQLLVKGPQMTSGYWNNADETKKKLQLEWLHTGDLFSVDSEGFFHFHGRADDMIVSGGENIYPREVEELLYRCPGVREAAVIGLPDPKWGQAVTAFVVRSDAQLTAQALEEFCRSSDDLASYKRPRKFIFIDRMPQNPSGKVLRHELIAHYQARRKEVLR
jgi:long-chain acyl-CoA synthetase